MNTLPTYTEQFNKITEAYIRGEIKPYDRKFCFCGTIGGGADWKHELYDFTEYRKMEHVLLSVLRDDTIGENACDVYAQSIKIGKVWCDIYRPQIYSHPNFEEALFAGMTAALEVLKQIHIERGEVIDEVPVFRKRNNPQQLCAGVIG